MMRTHAYRTIDVPVGGEAAAQTSTSGSLRVGVWDPVDVEDPASVPTVLLIHGVTASHLAWTFTPSQLPGHRLIAPDLRGRGRSRQVEGASSMGAHAADMLAVLDACGVETAAVVGHSMGGFVAVVLADAAPQRVSHLVLVDGGMPFDLSAAGDATPEQLVHAVLGPTAERLSMRFADVEEYLDFWREHPAFRGAWSDEVEEYFAYDLVPADTGEGLQPATGLQTTVEDMTDLYTGSTYSQALARVGGGAGEGQRATVWFCTVPRGLQDEEPGLYAPAYIEQLCAAHPALDHRRFDDLNHYTLVMSERGATLLGGMLREVLAPHPVG